VCERDSESQLEASCPLFIAQGGVTDSWTFWGGKRLELLPAHRVAHADLPIIQHLGECPTLPVGAHGGLEPGEGFFHPLAGLGLAVNPDPAVADTDDLAAAITERQTAHHEIRAAGGGVDVAAGLFHEGGPGL